AGGKQGQANLLCSIDGRTGMFYAIAAPQEQFGQQREMLHHVLRSLSFTGATGQGGAEKTEYVRWTEPNEHGYSCEVPKDWKVEGGLVRVSAVDLRSAGTLTS